MELSKVEHAKLDKAKETFNTQTLTKEQSELILGIELNYKVWRAYMTAESRKITRQKAIKYTQFKVYLENLNRSRQNHNLHSQILRNMLPRKPRGEICATTTLTSE